MRHVAALAVRDHQQAGAARVRGRRPPSAAQPGAPSRSKQASCSFTPAQAAPAASISARQWAATAPAARSAGVSPAAAALRIRQQLGRIGVEPEQQLALARADELRDAVAEVHRPREPAADRA